MNFLKPSDGSTVLCYVLKGGSSECLRSNNLDDLEASFPTVNFHYFMQLYLCTVTDIFSGDLKIKNKAVHQV